MFPWLTNLRLFAGASFLPVITLIPGIARAQDYQYRFGDETISPASADERRVFTFSSAAAKNYLDRSASLWTSTFVPGLLDAERRQEFVDLIWKHQREDGSWSIRTFATLETWGGGKKAEQLVAEPDYANPPGDGYQTGLAIVVLRDAGVPADDPRLAKAVRWLRANQRESGRWWTPSLNTQSRFHYITYSGSAYAALALAKCDALESVPGTADGPSAFREKRLPEAGIPNERTGRPRSQAGVSP